MSITDITEDIWDLYNVRPDFTRENPMLVSVQIDRGYDGKSYTLQLPWYGAMTPTGEAVHEAPPLNRLLDGIYRQVEQLWSVRSFEQWAWDHDEDDNSREAEQRDNAARPTID